MEKKLEDIIKKLQEPFSIKSLKFKPQAISKDKQSALLVTFLDARDVAQRLDDVVGVPNWTFKIEPVHGANPPTIVGTLSIKFEGEWVNKSDVGIGSQGQEDTYYKAAASDALKRCAVHFGLFRYAYDLKFPWSQNIAPQGKKENYKLPVVPYRHLADSDKFCEECAAAIDEVITDKAGNKHDGGEIICLTYYKHGTVLCPECSAKRK